MKNYVLILFLYLINSCILVHRAQSVHFSPERDSEVFRNLIVARSHLLLGSSDAIYRLDDKLVKQERKSLGAPNRMLVTDHVGSFRDSVLSCSDQGCFLAQITNFTNVSWQVDTPFIRQQGSKNVAAVFAPCADGTSDLTYGEMAEVTTGSRLLIKGSLVNAGNSNALQSFRKYAHRVDGDRFDPALYLTSFPLRHTLNDSGYIYFVVHQNSMETRVVRFCEDDPGIIRIFASHFEIVLQCGSHSNRAPSTSATFINTAMAFNDRPMIVVTMERVLEGSQMQLEVCAFDIGTINLLITQKFDDCVHARNNAHAGFARDYRPKTECRDVSNAGLRFQVSYPGN